MFDADRGSADVNDSAQRCTMEHHNRFERIITVTGKLLKKIKIKTICNIIIIVLDSE